ncbi:MAG: carboxymuconolactone decarboxylase family protein [Streptosporangiales bacterium]|nr:carboxymuconolactone decarboxylase family protein [Streptosporangiales bacterium]
MQARMKNPAMVIPAAMKAIQDLIASSEGTSLPAATRELVHLRVSQINGCSVCVNMGVTNGKKAGDTDVRLFGVAAWWDSPYYTDEERAALALAECATRLSDRTDPVPDDVWNEAAKHYDEQALAALLLWIGTTNLFNRLNVSTRQVAGQWG